MVSEKEKPNEPNCHKRSPKRGTKIELKQPKPIWLELNPVIASPFA